MQHASELDADSVEDVLLGRFMRHPVLRRIEVLDDAQFMALLLQRRFLSLIFAAVYDIGIDGLCDDEARTLVRVILREEYPDRTGATPSHREDLLYDLERLGATRADVLRCRPSAETTAIVMETLHLIGDSAASETTGDVKVLTMLRFWGEVLVSVEYGEYWRRMEAQFKAVGATSVFYLAHHSHDGSESLADASNDSKTHSGQLGACLKRLLASPGGIEAFADVEARILALRLRFYDQFLTASHVER